MFWVLLLYLLDYSSCTSKDCVQFLDVRRRAVELRRCVRGGCPGCRYCAAVRPL